MYGINLKIKDSLDHVVQRVINALKNEGFGILTQIDVQATLKEKLGVDSQPYLILGACNPQLAHHALAADADIGLLLPCNVVIREEDDKSITVSIMDPLIISKLSQNIEVEKVAQEASKRLERVYAALI